MEPSSLGVGDKPTGGGSNQGSVADVRTVSAKVNFPEQERQIREFWESKGIYAQSLARRQGSPSFVCLFRRPPHRQRAAAPRHCLTRVVKDIFPRYFTMKGFRCERKAGWDTHGLPVEVEVCKEIGIHSKEEIEGLRHRAVQPQMHRVSLPLHPPMGRDDSPDRLLGESQRGVCHPTIKALLKAFGGR